MAAAQTGMRGLIVNAYCYDDNGYTIISIITTSSNNMIISVVMKIILITIYY